MIKVLFVCLGNFCRSPTAEGIFRELVVKRGLADQFVIDSAGTGNHHVGSPPDLRSQQEAKKHHIDISNLRARLIEERDFEFYDYILAMDRSNLKNIQKLGAVRGQLNLLREFDPLKSPTLDVPDPYGLTGDAFQEVYEIVERSCQVLLKELQDKLKI